MISRYYDDLLRFCNLTVRDPDAARDVVQETYWRFLTAQREGAPVLHPKAFLRKIARHLLVDRHRRASIREHVDIDALSEIEQPVAPRHLEPEASLASKQALGAYAATIEALPPRCQEAFMLHVFDGMSYAEIARTMGISYSMVEKHIVRGVMACRMCERRLAAEGQGRGA